MCGQYLYLSRDSCSDLGYHFLLLQEDFPSDCHILCELLGIGLELASVLAGKGVSRAHLIGGRTDVETTHL